MGARLLKWVCIAVVLLGLQSCGGGWFSPGCRGGRVTIGLEPNLGPGNRTDATWRLPYKLGQQNTWRVQISGQNGSACDDNLKITSNGNFPFLPPGFQWNPRTGEMTSGVLTQRLEGECKEGDLSNVTVSVNGACPAGFQYRHKVYFAIIYTDYINGPDSPDGQGSTNYQFEWVE
jgi:hypothetical protein